MADIIVEKIQIGDEQYEINASLLGGHSSSYFQESNITQSINKDSSESQYPSAKAVYDVISGLPTAM